MNDRIVAAHENPKVEQTPDPQQLNRYLIFPPLTHRSHVASVQFS
jgi:hypothetical protein